MSQVPYRLRYAARRDIVNFMFCTIFSNGRWWPYWTAILEKNQISFMQGSLLHKTGTIPLRYSLLHILLFLVMEAILTGQFLFET